MRAGELTPERAAAALTDAVRLDQDVVPTDERLLLRAFALRASVRIRVGLYVALAERNRCPLVTTDGRLARSQPSCRSCTWARIGQRHRPAEHLLADGLTLPLDRRTTRARQPRSQPRTVSVLPAECVSTEPLGSTIAPYSVAMIRWWLLSAACSLVRVPASRPMSIVRERLRVSS